MLFGLWTGARYERTWHAKEEEVDFYDVKGVIESLCAALNVHALHFAPLESADSPHLRLGHGAQVYAGNKLLGVVGEITTDVLRNFDLKRTAFCFDLNFDQLMGSMTEEKHAIPLSRFPSTTRDMALILDDAVEAKGVLDFVAGVGEDLIGGVEVFDVYKGNKIPKGKKSVAFRFTYQSFERSLTDTEVNSIHEDISRKVLKAFNAQLPSS